MSSSPDPPVDRGDVFTMLLRVNHLAAKRIDTQNDRLWNGIPLMRTVPTTAVQALMDEIDEQGYAIVPKALLETGRVDA